MNVKASAKYQFSDSMRTSTVYYAIYFAICLAGLGIGAMSIDGVVVSISGTEVSTMIFLFVLGLNSFKEYFGMLVQNGMSRRAVFAGRLASFGLLAAAAALLEALLGEILALGARSGGYQYGSLYTMIFGWPEHVNPVLRILWTAASYMALLLLGYFISILFYRLNKAGKVVVGAGVPVLFFALPLLDIIIFRHLFITSAIAEVFAALHSLMFRSAWLAVAVPLALAALLAALSWLLLRRAIVRK